MSGHTPGPWAVVFRKDGTAYLSMGSPTSGPHKQFDIGLYADELNDADDARLIAAAPELLEALIACESLLAGIALTDYPVEEEWEQARAVIAKATQS